MLDIDPWDPKAGDEELSNADTSNRVCAYGVSREGKNVFSCVNGVRFDGETIEFKNGKNLSRSSPVYLEIQGHDELWLDTITILYDGGYRADYGIANGKGWCMSTNPNDDGKFPNNWVPANKCFRTLRLNTSGSVSGMQSSYALSIPGVQAQFDQAKASMSSAFGRWGRRLEEAEEDEDEEDDVDGADHAWADFEALPEDAWVELPGQERRLLENELLSNRLAALEEGL